LTEKRGTEFQRERFLRGGRKNKGNLGGKRGSHSTLAKDISRKKGEKGHPYAEEGVDVRRSFFRRKGRKKKCLHLRKGTRGPREER